MDGVTINPPRDDASRLPRNSAKLRSSAILWWWPRSYHKLPSERDRQPNQHAERSPNIESILL